MTRDFKILTTFWFLLGLVILLLNDFILKELYGNWLTGKLSDFAGLFIFPLFWTALFPTQKNKIFWLTGLLFIYWKSEFSHTLIDTWNNLGFLPISRVIDYTDFIALSVLPLAFHFENHKFRFKSLNLRPIIPLIFSAFAFMATSYSTEVEINKMYEFDFSKDTLQNKLAQIDSLNYGYGVKLTNTNPDTVEIIIPYDLCFDGFDAKVVIEEISSQKTHMTLLYAFHTCPEGDKDKEKATLAFEEMIIEKIKNMP